MTIQALIKELEKHPPDMLVMLPGYEGGFNDIETIELIPIKLNAHSDWWYGAHEKCDSTEATNVLVLKGENKNAHVNSDPMYPD